MTYKADITIGGNVICPYCGRWTGANIDAGDTSPVKCQYCGLQVHF
ncbi:MAG: hypothetical protein ACTSXW_08475 [Candidatus Baldrarchaeia archaeon]